jgi:hypothetical protein
LAVGEIQGRDPEQCPGPLRVGGGDDRRIDPEEAVLVELDVPVFTTARGMLNREDHDLLCSLVDQVIDKIAIFRRHEFADAFDILGRPISGKSVSF